MERRLIPVNAVIGLATSDGVNPAPLAERGYRVAGLEIPVTTTAGNVVIDVVIANGDSGHILAIESKCGGNIEEAQCVKYGQLDAVTVVRQASIDLHRRVAPSLGIVYACIGDFVDRVRLGLSTAGAAFPIFAIHDCEIALQAPTSAEPLQSIFASPVRLLAPPSRLIAFDADSDLSVIEPYVRAALVATLTQRVSEITLVALAERAIRHFALFGRKAQNALKGKVGQAARNIAEQNPQTFRYHPTTGIREGWVSLLKTPEANDPRGRTQGYQALGRPGRSGKRRSESGIVPGQMDLLSELDKADERTDGTRDEPPQETS